MCSSDLGGRVEMILISPVAIAPFTSSGKLRTIAITSGKRFPGMESVPAIAETLPGFQIGGWFLLAAPTGTPTEVTQRLNREVDAYLKEPEVVERLRTMGFATSGAGTTQSLQEFIRLEQARWCRSPATLASNHSDQDRVDRPVAAGAARRLIPRRDRVSVPESDPASRHRA